MHIDGLTLLVISLILSAVMTSLWLLSAYLFKTSPVTSIHYALTNTLLGSFMFFYICRGIWPTTTMFVLSDITVVAGCFVLRRSVQEFAEVKKTDKEHIILFLLSLITLISLRTHEGYGKFTVAFVCGLSLYSIIMCCKTAYEYMIKDFEKRFCIVTLSPLYFMGALTFVRIIATLLTETPITDLRQATGLNIAFLVTLMLALLGFNGTAVGLVISRMITKIKVLSQEDPLTKTFNRRHINTVAEEEISKLHKNSSSLALIVLDIDHFKKVNDKYGHAAGDAALLACVDVIKKNIRATDYVGRIGGEEFCIILPNTNESEAKVLAERIRVNLSSHPVMWENEQISITGSFGVTSLTSNGKSEWSKLLNKADLAMYEAKNNGRNQVVMA